MDAVEAYHERLFGDCNIPPVMGYAMIVRDCKESGESGTVKEPDPSMTYKVFRKTILSGLRMHRAQLV